MKEIIRHQHAYYRARIKCLQQQQTVHLPPSTTEITKYTQVIQVNDTAEQTETSGYHQAPNLGDEADCHSTSPLPLIEPSIKEVIHQSDHDTDTTL